MSEKEEITLEEFKKEVYKYPIEKAFIIRLLKIIDKNKETMIVVNKKFMFNTTFYANFIKDIDKNKNDSYYYKNFNKLKKFNLIHQKSSYFPKNLSLISINPNQFSLLSNNFSLIDIFYKKIEDV